MDYQHHYTLLIERAKARLLQLGYLEHHHIIPKCAGGLNIADNIVNLTPEEHYLAHQLLVKIYDKLGKKVEANKLAYALNLMSGKSNINRNNKYYGWIRRRVSMARTGYIPTAETLALISTKVKAHLKANGHHNKGKTNTDEYKKKMSERLKGRVITDETRVKMSVAAKGKPKSESHKKRFQGKNNPSYRHISQNMQNEIINDFLIGVPISITKSKYQMCYKKIASILIQNNIDPNLRTCIHCGKTGQTGNMLRWHFDNCKYKRIDSLVY